MNKERQELSELSQSFASELGKLQKLIASDSVSSDKVDNKSQFNDCMRAIYSVAENLHSRMDRISASMYAYQDGHSVGHLPAINGAGKMNKALAALGLADDFEASKKKIYASQDLFIVKGDTASK
jgi:hypothetical protein